jgi:predicted CXXCH cytochrome family protein
MGIGDAMASSGSNHAVGRTTAHRGSLIALAIAAAMLVAAAWGSARAADNPLSAGDQACLGCHGMEGMEKKAANSDILSLHIEPGNFGKSVHAVIGCTGCHTDVTLDSHPAKEMAIKSARDFAIASTEACRGCHSDKFQQWEGSIHASQVAGGNAGAPICTDCHRPHAVMKNAAETVESVPCQQCHGAIYRAYSASMHGQARAKGNVAAPICSGCHTAHAVKAANVTMADAASLPCIGCHAGALDLHKAWLPNAALHFDVVSCPVCHAPGTQRRVNLKLIDSLTQQRVTEQKGVPLFEARARSHDATGTGLDAVALWTLLRTFNREGMEGRTTLRGRLEVRTGVEAHQLAGKSKAISDCNTCHRQGSEAFQTVTVSVAGPDGRQIRYGAQNDVLNSVISIDSVSGFYAIGGTRIGLLDLALIMALLAGLAVPLGHMTLGWFVRQSLKKNGTPPASHA